MIFISLLFCRRPSPRPAGAAPRRGPRAAGGPRGRPRWRGASGFWTMARYSLPILTVVWNNLNYQTVRTNFHTFGGEMAKQERYPEVYLGDPEIDFVMLARAQGIDGARVTEEI